MEDLEQIVARNLADLRKSKNWTQAELAEKLNYSDKSISKWERGESLPDLKVLHQMAELFGVPLDYFVNEDAVTRKEQIDASKSEFGFRIGVELLLVSAVWLIAISLFAFGSTTSFFGKNSWIFLIWAIPASAYVFVFFSSRWKFRVCGIVFQSILCWTLLTAVFLQMLLLHYNLWHIFLIGLPTQAAIILWAQIRKRKP